METFKKYKWTIIMSIIMIGIFIYDSNKGINALNLTVSNLKTMLSFVPAIYIIIGLIDVWVPRDTMIKYMGENSGISGVIIALLLGSIAAGPLYVAFPVAAMLIKKGARFAYVLFFLGVWTSSKLPIMLYEIASFGGIFTFYHITSSLIVYFIGALVIEKILSKDEINNIYVKSQAV